MAVRRDLDAVFCRRIVNELRIRGSEALQATLHDVIPIQVLDQRNHPCVTSVEELVKLAKDKHLIMAEWPKGS